MMAVAVTWMMIVAAAVGAAEAMEASFVDYLVFVDSFVDSKSYFYCYCGILWNFASYSFDANPFQAVDKEEQFV